MSILETGIALGVLESIIVGVAGNATYDTGKKSVGLIKQHLDNIKLKKSTNSILKRFYEKNGDEIYRDEEFLEFYKHLLERLFNSVCTANANDNEMLLEGLCSECINRFPQIDKNSIFELLYEIKDLYSEYILENNIDVAIYKATIESRNAAYDLSCDIKDIKEILIKDVVRIENDFSVICTETGASVGIVDVSIKHNMEFPLLDIKLRNTGKEVVFLFKLEIRMVDYYQLENIHHEEYKLIRPSANYNIMLTEAALQVFDISQKIDANDVDRFTVTMATRTGEPMIPAICTFNARLYYNDNEHFVETTALTVVINNPYRIGGKYVIDTDMGRARRNYQNLKRINEIPSVKSTIFCSILESYEKNKKDFL